MNLVVYKQPEAFDRLKAQWNNLVQRSAANTIFSTWEWMSTWWSVYEPGTIYIVACYADDDTLVAIAPWFISHVESGKRTLSTIGCKEVTDYLDLIVDRDQVDVVLPALAQHLRASAAAFDTIFLCNLPEHAVAYQHFPSVLASHGFSVRLHPEDVCPVVSLPGNWQGYLAQLDKKQRHEIRRKMRRALGQDVKVDWYTVTEPSDLDEEMEHFFTLMAASDPEKAVFLEDNQNRQFFKLLAVVLQQNGWLQLNFLTVNETRAAAYMNFDYDDEVLVYNSGLDQDTFGHLSPGIVLLVFTIQHAIETGHHTFDFLQGNEEYKYRMGGQDRQVFNLEAHLDEGLS